MNVKSCTKGKRKRDYTMDPVKSSLDWKLSFLREFADFLSRWESTGRAGLTRETFLALRHTCLVLADCASYLLDRRGFKFVLLGQLQSDALESRFGWLRQLSGANYYISMQQLVESDRKIRAVSLLKFASVSLSDIDCAASEQAESAAAASSDCDVAADVIADAITFRVEPSTSDENIVYYVSGAIARSVVATTKCDSCKEALISHNQLPELQVEEELDTRASQFLNSVNRGGLVKPTQFVFEFTLHCWRVFEELRTTDELLCQLLQSQNQRLLVCRIMDRTTYTNDYMHLLFGRNMCTAGHDLQNHIVRRLFNCVAKNLVKRITYDANQQSGPSTKKRRVAKLNSSTSC